MSMMNSKSYEIRDLIRKKYPYAQVIYSDKYQSYFVTSMNFDNHYEGPSAKNIDDAWTYAAEELLDILKEN